MKQWEFVQEFIFLKLIFKGQISFLLLMYAPSFTAIYHLVCISYLSCFSTENSSLDWKEKVSKQISQKAFGPPF